MYYHSTIIFIESRYIESYYIQVCGNTPDTYKLLKGI